MVALKKKLVIIGDGLSGSTLAGQLSSHFETIVVTGKTSLRIKHATLNSSNRALTGAGAGGTKKLWHGALIEVDRRCLHGDGVFLDHISSFTSEAARLFGLNLQEEYKSGEKKYSGLVSDHNKQAFCGMPMFVPRNRSVVQKIVKNRDVQYIYEDVDKYILKKDRVFAVSLSNGELICGDIFIDCSGGLGSPRNLMPLIGRDLSQGVEIEEHLAAYIGSLSINNFADINSYLHAAANPFWGVRIPVVINYDKCCYAAIYLRPKYFMYPDSVYTRFGRLWQTKTFRIFAVFQTKLQDNLAFYNNNTVEVHNEAHRVIQNVCPDLVEKFVNALSFPTAAHSALRVEKVKVMSGAHFSGSLPVGDDQEPVGADFCLKGFDNLFVCSGATIKESGYSNTGLSIVSSALCLSHIILDHYRE